MVAVLLERYRSGDVQARRLALARRTVAMASAPGSYRPDVTSGDDALDDRFVSIRRAKWDTLTPVQREIQLEVSKAILDAGDPSISASGTLSPERVAEFRAEIAVWNASPSMASSKGSVARDDSAGSPQARLRALLPRLKRQLSRTFVPFAQWDAVAAQGEAKRICDAVTVNSVTDADVARLAKDVARMERAK